MKIYCCTCEAPVEARLTGGTEIYPHRPDLSKLNFWKCDACNNYVGCHSKTKDKTRPLGTIPSPELRRARQKLHGIMDPLWKEGLIKRGDLYRELSKALGKEFHTAETKTIGEVEDALQVVEKIATRCIGEEQLALFN